jgi:hypothetical protein
VLVAEEDHLVLQQSAVDRRDGLGIEIPGQAYAVDAGANVRAQFHHINGFSHGFIPPRDRGAVNHLAGREQNSRPARNDPIRPQFALVSVGFAARVEGAL